MLDDDIEIVYQRLLDPDVRLLTLTGPAGTGKTRLALAIGQRLLDAFEHGVFFVDLAPLSDPKLIVPTVAHTLGITEAAGLGLGWAPRDLRHTFVSLMSADGVPIEEIARLAGHNRTATTELVYRHELRPVITTGAEVMDRILNLRG